MSQRHSFITYRLFPHGPCCVALDLSLHAILFSCPSARRLTRAFFITHLPLDAAKMGMTMAQKRKARGPALAAPSKGKGRALPVITPAAAPPHKRAKLAAKAAAKASNRYGQAPECRGSGTHFSPSTRPRDDDDDDSGESEPEADSAQDAHAAMLAALEAHQASFFADALPSQPVASTGGASLANRAAAQKSVWEMDDADFLDDDDDEDEDEDDEEEAGQEEERDRLSDEPQGGFLSGHKDFSLPRQLKQPTGTQQQQQPPPRQRSSHS
jgi:hypothetical protein